jgi:hypothetical protein
MSLNTSDEGYNNGKKYGQKGTICGPNMTVAVGHAQSPLVSFKTS